MPQFTQDFITSRRNYPDGNTRIGETGRLWYDSITNSIRIGNDLPGGKLVTSSQTLVGYVDVLSGVNYTILPATHGLTQIFNCRVYRTISKEEVSVVTTINALQVDLTANYPMDELSVELIGY